MLHFCSHHLFIMKQSLNKIFYAVGLAEAISFIVLLGIAMPLKYMAGMPKAVSIVGMAHGVLFVGYLAVAYLCKETFHWSMRTFVLACAASVVPFGPFWFHKHLQSKA